MKKFNIILILIIMGIISLGCEKQEYIENNKKEVTKEAVDNDENQEAKLEEDLIKNIINKYESKEPTQWGERIDGVVNNLNTNEKIIALTFDACGGPNGSSYDKELIDYLISEQIPATLFINYRWIEANKETFLELDKNGLFEIENHGKEHRPLSVKSNSIYGIDGTNSIQGVIDEIKLNEKMIYDLTGNKTKYFRSGTAYYDEIGVSIAKELGYEVIGFSVNSDAGATFTTKEIKKSMKACKSGDIVIGHFNQPSKSTYEGLKNTLIELKNEGYKFVKLDDVL